MAVEQRAQWFWVLMAIAYELAVGWEFGTYCRVKSNLASDKGDVVLCSVGALECLASVIRHAVD